MVNEYVTPADCLEDVRPAGETRCRVRHQRFIFKLSIPLPLMQGHQSGQVDGPIDHIQTARFEVERFAEQPDETVIGATADLESHRLAAPPLPQRFLDRQQQVLDLVLVDRQVRVPRHPEHRLTHDAEAAEQLVDSLADQILKQHEAGPPPLRGQHHHTLQHRGHLHHAKQLSRSPLAQILKQDRYIQALVVDVREGMARIDRQRREHRVDVARKQPVNVLALRSREIRRLQLCDLIPD